MQHQLIMLAGASPGAGKSTLPELLFAQFTRHQLPTHWIYEEDILHAATFLPVVQVFQRGQGDAIAAILAATAQFVQESRHAHLITITDSIFPCYTWLFAAGYAHTQITAFSRQLAYLLQPLQPLPIYLSRDVARYGCRLMAEGEGRFRLQSTNRHVTFDTQAPTEPGWLVYTYGGREYWYDRVSKP